MVKIVRRTVKNGMTLLAIIYVTRQVVLRFVMQTISGHTVQDTVMERTTRLFTTFVTTERG